MRSQIITTGVPGKTLDSATASLFRRIQPGGYILFGRNIDSPRQLRKLVDDLRDLSEVEPFFMIDEEGGRVSRLRKLGHALPGAEASGARGDLALVERQGALIGKLMRLFGLNVNLAPVLEISAGQAAESALRGRCYSGEVAEVTACARAFLDGLRAEGVLGCGKHFPGYGGVAVDPHHALPVSPRSLAELEAREFTLYRALAKAMDSVMTGHVLYPKISDEGIPSSLSGRIVKGLLREQIGYRGLVMTDDLDMGAIAQYCDRAEAVRLAVEAGNDVVMICHEIETLPQVVDALGEVADAEIERALCTIDEAKRTLSPPGNFSETQFRELDQAVWTLRVETLGAEEAARDDAGGRTPSPVEQY